MNKNIHQHLSLGTVLWLLLAAGLGKLTQGHLGSSWSPAATRVGSRTVEDLGPGNDGLTQQALILSAVLQLFVLFFKTLCFRAVLRSQQNWEEIFLIPHSLLPHIHSLPHYQHPPPRRYIHYIPWTSSDASLSPSPRFTLGFIFNVVNSTGLDKRNGIYAALWYHTEISAP